MFDPARLFEDLAARLRDARLDALPDLVAAINAATLPRGQSNAEEILSSIAKKVMALPVPGSKLDAVQRAVVTHALAESGGNVSAAARLLGVERKALERKVARYKRGSSADDD